MFLYPDLDPFGESFNSYIDWVKFLANLGERMFFSSLQIPTCDMAWS